MAGSTEMFIVYCYLGTTVGNSYLTTIIKWVSLLWSNIWWNQYLGASAIIIWRVVHDATLSCQHFLWHYYVIIK